MEAVTVKFQEEVLDRIDRTIDEHNFNSRTEFIREAVRDKIENLSRDRLVNEFLRFRGKASKKTTSIDNENTRKIVSKELMEELDKRFR